MKMSYFLTVFFTGKIFPYFTTNKTSPYEENIGNYFFFSPFLKMPFLEGFSPRELPLNILGFIILKN